MQTYRTNNPDFWGEYNNGFVTIEGESSPQFYVGVISYVKTLPYPIKVDGGMVFQIPVMKRVKIAKSALSMCGTPLKTSVNYLRQYDGYGKGWGIEVSETGIKSL